MPEARDEQETDLHATLEELHHQLEHAEDLDARARVELRETLDEIRAALREEGPTSGMRDRIQAAVEQFEESHPTLVAAVGRVVRALAEMGI